MSTLEDAQATEAALDAARARARELDSTTRLGRALGERRTKTKSGAPSRRGRAGKGQTQWDAVIDRARTIVQGYDTPVTLRQLFYRLVAEQTIKNTQSAYVNLSRLSAEERRDGNFPQLADMGRSIARYGTFESPTDALQYIRDGYRRDRMAGQPIAHYIAVEKAGLVAQLQSWFGDLGIPVCALRGYSSESFEREIADDIERQGTVARILYAGDFDPEGEDIERNFHVQLRRRGADFAVQRVALNEEQVESYGLPVALGKAGSPRAAAFTREHGGLYQVEVDALPPETLRQLFTDAIAGTWDDDAYAVAIAQEQADRAVLDTLIDG